MIPLCNLYFQIVEILFTIAHLRELLIIPKSEFISNYRHYRIRNIPQRNIIRIASLSRPLETVILAAEIYKNKMLVNQVLN